MNTNSIESLEAEMLQKPSNPRFFHVASELYKEGDIIAPNNYQEKLKDTQRGIENELEEGRPQNKPERAKSVFAFTQLSDAYYFLKQHGGYLYEVKLDQFKLIQQSKSHIGDMGIVELLMQITNPDDRKIWINRYWDGYMLYRPCIEILIDSIVVKNILTNDYQKRNYFSGEYFHKYVVEYDQEYISLLNNVTTD